MSHHSKAGLGGYLVSQTTFFEIDAISPKRELKH
jgi:hypothetical protein